MDPLFMATSLFRRRRFEECVKTCTEILLKNPLDQVSRSMKRLNVQRKSYSSRRRLRGFLRLAPSPSKRTSTKPRWRRRE